MSKERAYRQPNRGAVLLPVWRRPAAVDLARRGYSIQLGRQADNSGSPPRSVPPHPLGRGIESRVTFRTDGVHVKIAHRIIISKMSAAPPYSTANRHSKVIRSALA
jgi:hypothetical protein